MFEQEIGPGTRLTLHITTLIFLYRFGDSFVFHTKYLSRRLEVRQKNSYSDIRNCNLNFCFQQVQQNLILRPKRRTLTIFDRVMLRKIRTRKDGHRRKCKILAGKYNLENQGADGRILSFRIQEQTRCIKNPKFILS
jgi:hypothetical protein